MSFVRANLLGWAMFETLTSTQMNALDLDHSRAIDGHAGGTYNPSASITVNNAVIVNSTGAAAANVTAITAIGKGTGHGVLSTGGANSGTGVRGTGGAPHGDGIYGTATGDGVGVYGEGASANGFGVAGFGQGGVAVGTYGNAGVYGIGGNPNGSGVIGEGNAGGSGVYGVGGVTNGVGVLGEGTGGGSGVKGTGGTTSGIGVVGTGMAAGSGVYGTGGATNGVGVEGAGTASGAGIVGTGGATSGVGVKGTGGAPAGDGMTGYGTGTGSGVYGEGGATSGYGAYFTGGAPNGLGAYVSGVGTGVGASIGCGASGANLRLRPKVGDPMAPAEGDIWSESGDDELIGYFATRKHQILDTWASISVAGGAPGAVTVNNQNNVSSVTIDAGGTYIQLNFARAFSAAKDFATVAIADGTRFVRIVNDNVTGYVRLALVSHDGSAVDMNATSYELRVVIKALFA